MISLRWRDRPLRRRRMSRRRGGRRPGAGRPTIAKQLERADALAPRVAAMVQDTAGVDPRESAKRLVAYWERELAAEEARGRFASNKRLSDIAVQLRLALELWHQMAPEEVPATPCVLVAPPMCATAAEW